jgi:hypothetical protein
MNKLLREVANVGRAFSGRRPITEAQAVELAVVSDEEDADWALWHADRDFALSIGIDKTQAIEVALEHIRERAISRGHAERLALQLTRAPLSSIE